MVALLLKNKPAAQMRHTYLFKLSFSPVVLYFVWEEEFRVSNDGPPEKVVAVPAQKFYNSKKIKLFR
jgi:hypothetical protein